MQVPGTSDAHRCKMAESENHLITQLGLCLRISSGLFLGAMGSSIYSVESRCKQVTVDRAVRQASMVQTSRPGFRIDWGL